ILLYHVHSGSILHVISFLLSIAHSDPPSFPTRRSSDLGDNVFGSICVKMMRRLLSPRTSAAWTNSRLRRLANSDRTRRATGGQRSEEHTSELQSRFDLVCRLLLEKKKTRIT